MTHVILWICKSVCAPRVSESFPVDPIDCVDSDNSQRTKVGVKSHGVATHQRVMGIPYQQSSGGHHVAKDAE